MGKDCGGGERVECSNWWKAVYWSNNQCERSSMMLVMDYSWWPWMWAIRENICVVSEEEMTFLFGLHFAVVNVRCGIEIEGWTKCVNRLSLGLVIVQLFIIVVTKYAFSRKRGGSFGPDSLYHDEQKCYKKSYVNELIGEYTIGIKSE